MASSLMMLQDWAQVQETWQTSRKKMRPQMTFSPRLPQHVDVCPQISILKIPWRRDRPTHAIAAQESEKRDARPSGSVVGLDQRLCGLQPVSRFRYRIPTNTI